MTRWVDSSTEFGMAADMIFLLFPEFAICAGIDLFEALDQAIAQTLNLKFIMSPSCAT